MSAQATIQVAVEATTRALPRLTEPVATQGPAEPSATPKPPDATAPPAVVVNVDASAPPPVVVAPPDTRVPPSSEAPAAGAWIVCVWCDHGTRDPLQEAQRAAGQLWAAGLPAAILWSSDYPGLNPGYWVTYSGVFGSEQAAATHAAALSRAGFNGRIRQIGARTAAPQSAASALAYWTAVVGSFGTRGEADALASRLRGVGINAMILFSSDYSSLNPGYWVTYVGRFSDPAGAEGTALRLRELGFSGAYAREIRR